MSHESRRWSVSALGLVALISAGCSSSDSGSTPDGGAALEAGGLSDASAGEGGTSEAGSGGGVPSDASTSGIDAAGSNSDGGCLALIPDGGTTVSNPDGDQCLHAASSSCFNQFAGLWSCEPTNNGNLWLIASNGYTYGANGIGQVAEGCTDCSGNWTTIASENQDFVNVGSFTIGDGGTTASLDWDDCSGSTLQDLQTCQQSSHAPYTQHTTCTLVASCAGP